jgi:hypothetical protein
MEAKLKHVSNEASKKEQRLKFHESELQAYFRRNKGLRKE